MKKRMLLLVMAMVFAFALKAKAEMVTFEFRGTITEIVNGSMGLGYAAHWGSPGDPFWGYLSYDPACHGEFCRADELSVSTVSMQQVVSYDSYPSGGGLRVRVTDSPAYDSILAGGEPGHGWFLALHLIDTTGTALSGTSMPAALMLTDWSSHYVDEDFGLGDGEYFRGDITSAQMVPEVNTAMLLIIGIIVLVGENRRRKNRLLE